MDQPHIDSRVRSRVRRPTVIAALVAIAVTAAVVMFATGSAVAHPSYGQPCNRSGCHTPTLTATATLTVTLSTLHPGAVVKLAGKVSPDHSGKSLSVTIQKSRTGTSWTAWKSVKISSTSTYTAKWTAPTTKGKYYFRTKFPGDNDHKKCFSAKRLVTVN
jgi:ABC-type phosphate transport system substrate-binding protein